MRALVIETESFGYVLRYDGVVRGHGSSSAGRFRNPLAGSAYTTPALRKRHHGLVCPSHAATHQTYLMARARTSSRVPLVLIVAAALAVVVVPIALIDRDSGVQTPATPTPGFKAVAKQIRTIPQINARKKNDLVRGLAQVLERLYSNAFVQAEQPRETPPSPQPTPATNVDAFFTSKARAALRKDPDVFRTVGSVHVTNGQVAFGGIVTLESSQPVQAFLDVNFAGTGSPAGADSPRVKITQEGTLLLNATSKGWRVAGFDLKLGSETIEPTPTAEAA